MADASNSRPIQPIRHGQPAEERPEVASLDAPRAEAAPLVALAVVQQEARYHRTRLLFRAKVLIWITVLSLLSAGYWLYRVIPELLDGSDAVVSVGTIVGTANAMLQIGTAGYFLLARDPGFAQNVLKVLLLVAGLEALMSIVAYGASGWFTLLNMILLLVAYAQMPLLRYGKDL